MNTEKKKNYPFKAPTSEYSSFPERLRYTMTLRDYSVNDLATDLYVSKSTICGYRNGSRSPDIPMLRQLCQALQVSSDFLIGLQDDIRL